MSSSNPIDNAINSTNKFNSPGAYSKYIDNYNYLINDASLANENKVELSDVNRKLISLLGGDDINFFDKYLITDAYDNILGDINTAPHRELLRSSIMSEIQHKKIANLNNKINSLEAPSEDNDNSKIMAVKNYGNSRILNVEQRKNYDADRDNSKYVIYGNGGCLAYDPTKFTNTNSVNGTKLDESYKQVSFEPCNAKNTNQLFEINKIANAADYNRNLGNSNPPIPTLSTSRSDYSGLGYYIVSPVNKNGTGSDRNMCLNFTNSGLSVKPCDMSINQKYSKIDHHV